MAWKLRESRSVKRSRIERMSESLDLLEKFIVILF